MLQERLPCMQDRRGGNLTRDADPSGVLDARPQEPFHSGPACTRGTKASTRYP